MIDGTRRTRILFVFAWLVVGSEETELRLLARWLDPRRYQIDAIACFRKPEMSDQVHEPLEALGVDVDRVPYELSFADTVDYLARKITAYDIVVSCQNVADIYPALEKLHWRPPLIERGGLVSEALAGPKHFTSRYVGVCATVREAAASKMPGREHHALEIPSMVDLGEFDIGSRLPMRLALGIERDELLIGWVGRLERKKRVEDFIEAATLVTRRVENARFAVVGGPDAFMPEYAESLKELAELRGLSARLIFLGDRSDVPALLSAFDIFVWLSRGEGMPHIISEAGAAALPVIATPDNGSVQQIEDGVSGIFVPHESPPDVADAMERLARDPWLRRQRGEALREKVRATYAAEIVVPLWEGVFRAVLEESVPASPPTIFASFVQAGFECSTHHRRDGRRLDLIAATEHDRYAASDYRQIAQHGLRTVRDGLRWHLIEPQPGRYDWSSFLPMLRAARDEGAQVIWDLMHYGWPDDIDIWSPAFVRRFASFAGAAARIIRHETDDAPFYCPINEISFHSWAGGDVAYLDPFARGRGFELKAQLVRASIAAMEELLAVDSRARFVHCEPAINVIADPGRPGQRLAAEAQRLAQFQAWDMLGGFSWPQLGGSPRFLDIVGINYYPNNQWHYDGAAIAADHPCHRPFRYFLAEAYARYGRPIAVSETGTEGESRATWFEQMSLEVAAARLSGIPVEGICLYPIVDHLGWEDDRECPSGLFACRLHDGRRAVDEALATAVARSVAAQHAWSVPLLKPVSMPKFTGWHARPTSRERLHGLS